MIYLYMIINFQKSVRLYDMNPVSWTWRNEVFIMSKLSYEDKINLYVDMK